QSGFAPPKGRQFTDCALPAKCRRSRPPARGRSMLRSARMLMRPIERHFCYRSTTGSKPATSAVLPRRHLGIDPPPDAVHHQTKDPYLWETTVVRQTIETARTSVSSGRTFVEVLVPAG